MKTIYKLIFMFSAFPAFAFAQGGGMGGGGGVSVVCRNPQGAIISAQILDIFEGKNQFGLTYSSNGMTVDTMVELSQLKLISDTEFLNQFKNTLNGVKANLVFLPKGVGLTPTNDAFPTITKKGCNFEQLANYKDNDSKVYVDEEIYKHLSKLDKAALLIHETVYKMARVNRGETSSIRSRKLTSQMLAGNTDTGVINALMNELRPLPPSMPTPTPVFVPADHLNKGKFYPGGNFCGIYLSPKGNDLVLSAIDGKNGPCSDVGITQFYTWSRVNTADRRDVWAYEMECKNDPNHWCALIEVLDPNTVVMHWKGVVRTYYR